MVQVVWKPQHLQEGYRLQHTKQSFTTCLPHTSFSPIFTSWVMDVKNLQSNSTSALTCVLSCLGAHVLDTFLLH